MARIQNPRLSVADGPGTTINVTVSCSISWTQQELSSRTPFNLEVYFRGDDVRNDDHLNVHIFHPEVIENPVTPRSNPQTFSRTFNIQSRRFNEDKGVINKKDEVYGEIRLRPENIVSAYGRTNTITGLF